MKKLLPILFFVITVIFFFKPFFLSHLLPIPSDTIVGLYNPFRDVYKDQYPRGIPFKNFLITDPVRQQFPWRQLVIDTERYLQLPLWNPYNGAGIPLLANFQSAPFYPLNLLFFVMPFSIAWSLLVVLQPLLGGLFLYLYLKNLKLHPLACVIGSISFAFSGFAISWLEWNTIFQTALWVPLILLSIDKINEKLKDKIYQWYGIFLISLICSFFAGHLQTFFYIFLIVFIYLIAKLVSVKSNKKIILLFVISYFLFIILTLPQWFPTLQFIALSARNVDQIPFSTDGWFVPFQHLIQFIAPDFFGNPTTLNYWGAWNYGELVGYIGIIPLIFALFAVIFRHDKKTWFFSGLVFVSLLFALPTPIAKLPYILNVPFLATAQPTRLLFVVDFALAILAALGLDYFLKNKKIVSVGCIVIALGVMFGILWITVLKLYPLFGITSANAHIAKQNMIFPTGIFLAGSALIIVLSSLRGGQRPTWQSQKLPSKARNDVVLRYVILLGIILITAFDLFHFAQKFTPFTKVEYLFPSTKTISFLQKNIGDGRIMTTDSQILPPNFSLMYGLQSVDVYDPLYLRSYGEFIAASERGVPNTNPPFGFNRIITPHNYQSPLINLLGVKYILSLSDIKQQGLRKVMQEGDTRVYENTKALPRTFFVDTVSFTHAKQEAINMQFAQGFDQSKTAVVLERNKILEQAIGPELDRRSVTVVRYSPNEILLKTQNSNDSFLVLTDSYYPTWHAYIDGKETKIYLTDFAFRGIFIPGGKHTIIFQDGLF